ncbi:MAG: magnesium transporter CorA family protein [Clostridia bacterium]|nr:magnesium transporter CorA family protein [Clostridia bacterium]
MIKIYNTDLKTNKTELTDKIQKGCWINMVNPSEKEIKRVCEEVKIEEAFIRYPLDYEEQARIDQEDDAVLFVIDVPLIEYDNENKIYTTMPLGMIVVRDDFFITVCLKKSKVIESFEAGIIKNMYTYKKTRFILQILYYNASHFLNLLKQLNKETEIAESVLQKSMRNKELLKLLSLEKGLVYFTTSLRSNEAVMERTLRGKIVKMYEEDEDILEDAIVENKQALEMSKVYQDILNGTMEAYGSIISNNLNSVMKYLTSVTIILSLPTMIGSFWGMNVSLPFADNPWAFGILIVLSIIISLVVAIFLRKKDMF